MCVCVCVCVCVFYRDIVAAVDRQQSFKANKLYYVVSVNICRAAALFYVICTLDHEPETV